MNLKNEKTVLIFAPFNKKSDIIINDLLDSKFKIRILTDNLKGFKKNFFDVWEKFESVSQIDLDHSNFMKNKEKYFEWRNRPPPDYIIFIKLSNSSENLFLHELDIIEYLKTQKQLRKIILIQINHKERGFYDFFDFNSDYSIKNKNNPLRNTLTNSSIDNIYKYYLESAIRQSGINYLIIKNLNVPVTSSIYADDHVRFVNMSDFLLRRINQFALRNFKELISKVIDDKIFLHDSTYAIDKTSYNSIIKYSTPQFIIDYYNFLYRDSYLKKLTTELKVVTNDNTKLIHSSDFHTLITFGLGVKILGCGIRFFINTLK